MKILVTGGCGYVGSHTVVELIARGHEPVVVDNFSNSSPRVLDHLERICGVRPACFEVDIRDKTALSDVMQQVAPEAVIHFAALKAVGESCEKPLAYFDNNISGTITLLQAMLQASVPYLVFSSSATVYGAPDSNPIREDAPLRITNPYGRTKLVMERLIGDVCEAHADFHAGILRYFNPVGAHPSGDLGEDPTGVPANLMPYVCQVACGQRECLDVFGDDYDTPDGTGVRDYIHIMDLARAHADAIDTLVKRHGSFTVNLGTGRGYSVLELIAAFEQASGRKVAHRIAPRRRGDVATCYADPSLAAKLLGWRADLGIDRMCEDAWRWQSRHPTGYRGRTV